MAKFHRIPTAVATVSVREFAREVVGERVRAAVHYWERIAKRKAPRVEDIHQLRVWSRRSLAALELFAAQLPKDSAAELSKLLNKTRKRAGKARDCDILRESVRKGSRGRLAGALDVAAVQRAAACQKLSRSYRKKVKSKEISDLLEAVLRTGTSPAQNGKPRAGVKFGPWFEKQFVAASAEFRQLLQLRRLNAQRIHPLRIAGKRVRYALEIGLTSLPEKAAKALYTALEDLQEHLGEICDHQALEEQFRELASQLKSKDQAAALHEADRHAELARDGSKTFAQWWQADEGRQALLAHLETVIGQRRKTPQSTQRRKSQEK